MLIAQKIKLNPIKSLDRILFVNILYIWNLRYFRNFLIIKYIDFELIIFTINLDVMLFFKVFIIFYFVILLIILLI